jgi:beta-glucosidase-like glycosyl hydrolase
VGFGPAGRARCCVRSAGVHRLCHRLRAELIERYKLGGVIYFAWSNNVNNPDQIAGLSNGMQDAALDQKRKIPALVAADQEGGIVARVGPTRSTEDAQTAAAISGTELEALGINWNFAPVADVNVNPANPVIGVRSFSSDPTLAADMTAAQVRGYQDTAGSPRPPSTSPVTATPRPTATPASRSSTTPARSGRRSTSRLSRPPSTRASAPS